MSSARHGLHFFQVRLLGLPDPPGREWRVAAVAVVSDNVAHWAERPPRRTLRAALTEALVLADITPDAPLEYILGWLARDRAG